MNIKINYPSPNFKIKEVDGKSYLFDYFRKKFLLLTPEEWVRQNIVQALVQNYQYPAGRIALEKLLIINNLKKRYDVVIYDAQRKPWMLIECKATTVALNEDVLKQTLQYYSQLQCPYILITNGSNTFIASFNGQNFLWLDSVPGYNF